jgi:hypothetical protein
VDWEKFVQDRLDSGPVRYDTETKAIWHLWEAYQACKKVTPEAAGVALSGIQLSVLTHIAQALGRDSDRVKDLKMVFGLEWVWPDHLTAQERVIESLQVLKSVVKAAPAPPPPTPAAVVSLAPPELLGDNFGGGNQLGPTLPIVPATPPTVPATPPTAPPKGERGRARESASVTRSED